MLRCYSWKYSGSLQEVQGPEEEQEEEEEWGEMWVWFLVCLVRLSDGGEEERETATERNWEEGLHERDNWEKSMLEFQIFWIILKSLSFIFSIYL